VLKELGCRNSLSIRKSFKGGRKDNSRLPIRKRVALAIHLWDQERSCESRLLAGGARIHVDFHADRHFYDLWCLPGHLALLVVKNRTVSALSDKLIRNLNFASKIFASNGNGVLHAATQQIGVRAPSNQCWINGFLCVGRFPFVAGDPNGEFRIKHL
jgi:hypothetical protein